MVFVPFVSSVLFSAFMIADDDLFQSSETEDSCFAVEDDNSTSFLDDEVESMKLLGLTSIESIKSPDILYGRGSSNI